MDLNPSPFVVEPRLEGTLNRSSFPLISTATLDVGIYIEDITSGSHLEPAILFPTSAAQQPNVTNPWLTSSHNNESVYGIDYFSNATSSIVYAGYVINKYYLWVVFAFGFPGNLATMITISRMRHFGSFVLYIALLAMADNLALIVKILFYQLLLHQVHLGSAGCRALQFSGIVLASYCSWVLVLMAIERLVAVRYPFRIHFQSCLSSRKTISIVSAVGIIISVLCLPTLWATDFDPERRTCHSKETPVVHTIHWICTSLYAFIPCIILTVCNFLVAREIRLSFRLRNSFRSVHHFMVGRRSSDVPIQKQIMLMLFTATFVFILLHFPICLFLVVPWRATIGTRSFEWRYLVSQIVYLLADSNHAFNFYLYFLSARKFRAHFTHMLVTCERKHKCSKCAEERYPLRRLQT